MPANLVPYRVQSGERSNYAKFDGLINTVQGSLRTVGDQTKNQWGSGKILAPSQLSQGGATTGQALVWNGSGWVATTVPTRTPNTTTSTVDIVNDATEKDLFTGNAPGSTAGFLVPAFGSVSGAVRIVAGGDYLNNTASGRKITLRVAAYDVNTSTLKTLWQDQSAAIPNTANRRSWRFRLTIQPLYDPTHHPLALDYMFGTGLFAMSESAAATTGLGKLTTPANVQLWAPLSGTDTPDMPSAAHAMRPQFLLTHPVADTNLSMRCLFARVEVTL